jgi:parallel beta helix pectate lyase-like protein
VTPSTVSMPMRTFRSVAVGLGFCALPLLAHAAPLPPGGGRTAIVDCARGDKISTRITAPRTAVIVKGTCTENLVIPFDDVSIRTDGVTPATIVAADPDQPTILFEGSRRGEIDGGPSGLTINGGTFGIVATRGAAIDVKNCLVTNTSNTAVIASYGSSLVVDNCTITGNTGNGAGAANTSSLVITNSRVSSNALTGLFAARSSYVRLGQDASGTPVVKPVTVSANGTTGVDIIEGSAGHVVGGTVQDSGGTNIFVGQASSGQIGLGTNNLTGGVTVQNSRRGIVVEGANATILLSTITGATLEGINVNAAGSARIGVRNGNTSYGANTISGNGTGIGVFQGGAAYIGGNTVTANTGFGINVFEATATIIGGNAITNNGQTGVFVHAGTVDFGNAGFELTTTNTISGNGSVGPNTGGIFAFKGGNILVNNATISNNSGPGVQVFEAGIIELRGSTAVTVPGAGSTAGALVQFGSTLRVRDTASIISATGDGIQASNLTSVDIRDPNTVQGNGAGGVGVRCFGISGPASAAAVTLTGNLAGVSGNAGATAGCNVFP